MMVDDASKVGEGGNAVSCRCTVALNVASSLLDPEIHRLAIDDTNTGLVALPWHCRHTWVPNVRIVMSEASGRSAHFKTKQRT